MALDAERHSRDTRNSVSSLELAGIDAEAASVNSARFPLPSAKINSPFLRVIKIFAGLNSAGVWESLTSGRSYENVQKTLMNFSLCDINTA